jgi:D-glycero-alpha-D-manno-heptose-7-phosphate kinase
MPVTPSTLAEAACHIEIDVLGEPVGKQDQYVAAHGGICAYTFNQDGSVDVESLELEERTLRLLRDHLLLFYTGEARSAATVLGDQDKRSREGDTAMLENLHATKEMGYRSRDLLLEGDLEGYAELMHEHWENKRKRSPGMASEHIDELYTLARRSGAIGGKLVGAGGGGFLLVYATKPADTRQAMAAAGAQELPFAFEFNGATASEFR